ncbi:MAG: LPXTG cell wall anchor domain-containing protein [Lachnospiraceae bacterium]|nr:LPXTG cell wall anchor domain-containing protein [Lachnospiraceae bacterium]
MKKIMKKCAVFFTICAMLMVYLPRVDVAADLVTIVTTESEFINALNQDGTIVLNADIFTTASPIEIIGRNLVLDLNGHTISTSDATADSVVFVSNSTVVIENNSEMSGGISSVNGAGTGSALKVSNLHGEANVTIKAGLYSARGYETFVVEESTAQTGNAKLTIEDGTFDGDTNGYSLFKKDGGEIVLNGGQFQQDPSLYLGENRTVVHHYGMGVYEVRSTIMSPEFQAVLKDGKITIPAMTPTEHEAVSAYVSAYLAAYNTDEYIFMAEPVTKEDNTVDTTQCDIVKEENGEREVHRIPTVYAATVDENAAAKVKSFVGLIEQNQLFYTTDLEIVNYWIHGFDAGKDEAMMVSDITNYSGELKELMDNSNVRAEFLEARMGEDSDLFIYRLGDVAFSYEGVYYGYTGPAGGCAQNVIYVPDDTATTTDALMAAAQSRINTYLGNDTQVVLSYGGIISDIRHPIDPNDATYYEYVLDEMDLQDANIEHYFIATVNGVQHKLLIIPNSNKMKTPTYSSIDASDKVEIHTPSPDVPLDTNVEVDEIVSGDEYDRIVQLLDVKENVTYDLNLYSKSIQDYITKIDNAEFEVRIPIPRSWAKKTLMAYYVDGQGNVSKHTVTIDDSNGYYAVFYTDHFSIYTIAEAKTTDTTATDTTTEATTEKPVTPNTGDDMQVMPWFGLMGLGLVGLIGSRKVRK